ncbi:hypothetical protein [Azospirillum picis]|uniref:Uncharacterized protein n=1 Tax=Azospirillum picis TaxID=488438 RepID=A0ABU0MUK0_9PROT|nr:hypothetical protein [Azospirillum picis]MBP2303341.1 hypothetical protein [Azospirillum picis]MDQ0537177.1 hypothetical protein [Azospirillum picis]
MSIPKPPPRNRKGSPPAETDVPRALFEEPAAPAPAAAPVEPKRKRDTPFNFRVEKDLARRFGRRAFDLEVDNVDLLEAMVDLYLDDDRLAAEVTSRVDRKRKA